MQLKSLCSCFFVSLVRESGSRVQISGSCEALGPAVVLEGNGGPGEGSDGLNHTSFEEHPRNAATPGAGISVPSSSPSEDCTDIICHPRCAERKSQARFNDICQPSRPLTAPLPWSRFQNLFAFAVALFPSDIIKWRQGWQGG